MLFNQILFPCSPRQLSKVIGLLVGLLVRSPTSAHTTYVYGWILKLNIQISTSSSQTPLAKSWISFCLLRNSVRLLDTDYSVSGVPCDWWMAYDRSIAGHFTFAPISACINYDTTLIYRDYIMIHDKIIVNHFIKLRCCCVLVSAISQHSISNFVSSLIL